MIQTPVLRQFADIQEAPIISLLRGFSAPVNLTIDRRDEELVLHTEIGMRHGLSRTEIEEINLHIATYAGFPAAMAASMEAFAGPFSPPIRIIR